FDGTNWASNGSIASGAAQDLTGVVNGTNVQLFVTSPTSLFAFTDATGIGGTLTGTLGAAIATAPTNTAFRGVGVFPVPEPAPILLAGGAALGLLGWRRRRGAGKAS